MTNKNKIKTSFMIDEEILKEVKHLCIDLNISQADFMRKAIKEKLERENQSK